MNTLPSCPSLLARPSFRPGLDSEDQFKKGKRQIVRWDHLESELAGPLGPCSLSQAQPLPYRLQPGLPPGMQSPGNLLDWVSSSYAGP